MFALPWLQYLELHPDFAYGGVTRGGCIVLGMKHLSPGTRIDVVIHRTCNTGDALSSKEKITLEAKEVNDVKVAIQIEAGDRVIEFMEKTQTLIDGQISDIREKLELLTEDQVNRLTAAKVNIKYLTYLLKYMRSSLRMELDDRNPNIEWRTMVEDFCNDVDQAIRDLSLPDSSPPPDSLPLENLKSGLDENLRLLPVGTTKNLRPDVHISKDTQPRAPFCWAVRHVAVRHVAVRLGPRRKLSPRVRLTQRAAPHRAKRTEPRTQDKSSSSQSSDQSEDAKAYSSPIDSRVEDLQRDTDNLEGTGSQIERIIKYFKDNQQQSNCKVVSIVGFGGIGKTSLAKRVFHKIKKKFDCVAFVTVSQNMSMDNLIRDILLQFNPMGKRSTGKDDPLDQLKNFLKDKRYFVVLDDIWKEEHWKEIKSLFSTNRIGSAMITTTRIRSIAKLCVQNDGYLLDMKPLSMSDSKKLFLQRIFGSEKDPSYPEQSCNGIVQKCGGSPLAIITVSSLLANNNASPHHWEEVHKKLIACEFLKETGAEDMLRRLSLSFDDLPYPIGMCLLYLSIFPEDYEFNRKDLINRWIAEGLIGATGKKTKSVVGEYYFYELINRSLIEPVKIRYDGKVKACRVHDTILDFLVSKSTEINFATLLGPRVIVSDNKIRRLSMQNIQEADVNKLEGRDLSQMHSVSMFGAAQIIPSDKDFPYMRVLSLENSYNPKNNHPSEGYPITNDTLSKLSRLEYLNHGASCTMGFLSEIRHLQFLRTLDLKKASITELPPSTLKLRHLVRLLVCYGTKLPDQIGEMAALEELKYVDITCQSESFMSELAMLTKLRLLVIGFAVHKMLDTVEKVLVSSLSRLDHSLQSLSVHISNITSSMDLFHAARAGEIMKFSSRWELAVKNLHKFSIWSGGYIRYVPGWMGNLPMIRKLRLRVQNIDKDALSTLGNLKNLVDLFLDIINIPEDRLVYGNISHWFPKLEYFGIITSISGMTYLTFEEDLMKQVKYVKLDLTADSRAAIITTGLDFGIQYLRSLTMLHVNIQCGWGDEKVFKKTKTAIQNAAKLKKCIIKFEHSGVDDETEEDKEDDEVDSQEE